MNIYECTVDDVKKLNYICRLTFTETFEDTNTPENLNQYLDEAYSIPVHMGRPSSPDGSVFSFTKCQLMQARPPLCSLFHIYIAEMLNMPFDALQIFFLTLWLSI